MSSIKSLYEVIESRKQDAAEGSYTAYLFKEGEDKILKKIGEESAEVIIAAKSNNPTSREDLKNEICDLTYHLLVLMAQKKIPLEEVEEILEERAKKQNNLKQIKQVNKDS
jgi:phosphoribosyl-ATP pyrophosphohydrolase